ncbi:hypothetical protein PoB_005958900 [Plakobranchus ocellatus]|uniref:Uncharacterized protein n=1 Tax=Plakobranchus ocellatus TaxID=259542 RepID=A0AAV4CN66_9GAST|nr:hypothetical protein PoB_005958900 [Plakobranchus ocellatus]
MFYITRRFISRLFSRARQTQWRKDANRCSVNLESVGLPASSPKQQSAITAEVRQDMGVSIVWMFSFTGSKCQIHVSFILTTVSKNLSFESIRRKPLQSSTLTLQKAEYLQRRHLTHVRAGHGESFQLTLHRF